MDDYTKQCDCPEIQDGCKLKVGSYLWYLPTQESAYLIALGTNETYMLTRSSIEDQGHFWAGRDDFIALPTIEQLMGMVEPIFWKVVDTYPQVLDEMYNAFSLFIFEGKTNKQWPYGHKVTNQELWLAFVMHELHNLTWRNGKWIK